MKQVLQRTKGALQIEEVPKPALKPGGVLVRNISSLVSAGTERSNVSQSDKSLLSKAVERPDLVHQVLDRVRSQGLASTVEVVTERLNRRVPMGYSSAGVVVAVGEGAEEFYVGQPVACAGGGYASHAEYIFVPKNLCAAIPLDRPGSEPDYESAAFATVGAIALQGVRQSEAVLGETVAVVGLGLIGLLTVQLLSAAGCSVIGIDLSESRVELARTMGARWGFTGGRYGEGSDASELVGRIMQVTRGLGVDRCLLTAATSSNEPIRLAGDILRDRGTVVIVGDVRADVPRDTYYGREIDVRFSRSYGPGRYDPAYEERGLDYPIGYVRWTEKRNLESFLQLLAAGKIDAKKLITHRFTIENAAQAYDLLLGKTSEPYLGIVLNYPDVQRNVAERATAAAGAPAKQIRVGFVGAGEFAKSMLLPIIKKHRDVSLEVVAAATSPSAQSVATHFGFKRATCDSADIYANETINTVVIAARHNLHASAVASALTGRKHVFVEKPLCITEEQFSELLPLLQEQHAGSDAPVLMVGFNRRFAPFGVRARDHFIGRTGPLSVHYRVNAGFIAANNWVHSQEEGGGRIIGEGCHFLDFANFLVGTHPIRVAAESITTDSAVITVKYLDGSVATVQYLTTGCSAMPKERVEIVGDGKHFIIDDYRSAEWGSGGRKGALKAGTQDKGHAAEINAFLSAIRTGGPSPIGIADIIWTTELTFRAAEAMRTGATIDVRWPVAPNIAQPEGLA